MKKKVLIAVAILALAASAVWAAVTCPYHPLASCHGTGQVRHLPSGTYQVYHCSCGEDVLVKD